MPLSFYYGQRHYIKMASFYIKTYKGVIRCWLAQFHKRTIPRTLLMQTYLSMNAHGKTIAFHPNINYFSMDIHTEK